MDATWHKTCIRISYKHIKSLYLTLCFLVFAQSAFTQDVCISQNTNAQMYILFAENVAGIHYVMLLHAPPVVFHIDKMLLQGQNAKEKELSRSK